jgi:hypothetical protein
MDEGVKKVATIEAGAHEYYQTVRDIAEDCREPYLGPDDERRYGYIHDSIDGSYWVIYHHANEVVLQASGNEPDGAEVRSMSKPDADWREMRQLAAYLAMEADVHEALRELDE